MEVGIGEVRRGHAKVEAWMCLAVDVTMAWARAQWQGKARRWRRGDTATLRRDGGGTAQVGVGDSRKARLEARLTFLGFTTTVMIL